jgi:uncharacterized membrane protein
LTGLVLVGITALGTESLPVPVAWLRLLLGLAHTLFVPGYCLQAALFVRKDDLDGPQRLALSFALSIAVVPPLALIMDRLPWGIRLWPTVVAGGLYVVTCSVVAVVRRRRVPRRERISVDADLDPVGWWAAQDRTSRTLYVVLTVATLVVTLSAFAISLAPKPRERFTEFYILGAQGLAEDYPQEVALGQPVDVTVGIGNREGVLSTYRVAVVNEGRVIGQNDWVALAHGTSEERIVTFTPDKSGEDVEVEFLLYRDGNTESYRALRLWITVTG